VEGVALGGALVGGELAVDAHVLRFVHGGDAELRRREVRLDRERLARRVERPRVLALGALVVALARLLAGPHDRVEPLRDLLSHRRGRAGIPARHREPGSEPGAADVAYPDGRGDA